MRNLLFVMMIAVLTAAVAGCSFGSESPEPTTFAAGSPSPTTQKPSPQPTSGQGQLSATIDEIYPSTAYLGDVVTLNGHGNPSDQIQGYRWSIQGEGPFAFKDSIVSSVLTEAEGTVTIVFEVQHNDGRWSEPAIRQLTVLPRPPSADFTAKPTSGSIPLKVDFSDITDKRVTSWQWDFGDGYTSKIQNPSHTYVQPGVYTVILTVEGPDGSDTEVKQDLIEAIDVEFTASPTTGYRPLEVQFTDLSRMNITNRAWNFGDGVISNEPNPTHIYDQSGIFSVTITVVGQSNATITETRENYIQVLEPPPVADFFCHTTTQVGVEDAFTDRSEGIITAWKWDFGDGTSSNKQNPSNAFAQAGTYTVRLTVEGPGGSDFTEKTVTVEEPQ